MGARVAALLSLAWGCTAPTVPASPTNETPPPGWTGWQEVVAAPCALGPDRLDVTCWWDDPLRAQNIEFFAHPQLRELVDPGGARVRGSDDSGASVRVACSTNSSSSTVCMPSSPPLATITDTGGLTKDGLLWEFGNLDLSIPDRNWHVAGNGGVPSVVDANGYAAVVLDTMIPYPFHIDSDPIAVVGGIYNRGSSYACILTDDGIVHCDSDGPGFHDPFPNPPYRRLVGDSMYACAQRSDDHVVECTLGPDLDWGPLIDLDAGRDGRVRGVPATPTWNDDTWVPNLCGITLNNEIRCSQSSYTDDLHQRLEAVNAEHAFLEPAEGW